MYKRKNNKRRVIFLINDEICKVRDKLNKSIEDGEDYKVIYQISVELDELIAEFYSQSKKEEEKKQNTTKKLKSKKKLLIVI